MAIVKPENASTPFITEIRHGTPSIAELIEFLDRNLLELNQ